MTSFSNAKIIGYGYSNALYDRQEFFYRGFLLGLGNKKIVYLKEANKRRLLGAYFVAQQLNKLGTSILVGFPTSHEAILASRIAVAEKILFISVAAQHSSLAKKGTFVFTVNGTLKEEVRTIVSFLNKRFGNKKGLIISNPKNVFSMDHFELFKRNKKTKYLNTDFSFLNNQLKINQETIKKLKNDDYHYLVINTYPKKTLNLFKQLKKNKIELPIMTNSSWNIANIDEVRRFLVFRKNRVFSVSNIEKKTKNYKKFKKMAFNKYGKNPTSEMAYGYDLGVIIAETIERLGDHEINKKIFRKKFLSNLCFQKVINGKLCFNKKGGHALRKSHIVKFSKEHEFQPIGEEK